MTRIVEAVVAKVEEWKGKSISIQPLPGGLTNANFRVDVNGDSYFVRVPGVGTELLAINRENEFFNTSAAAQVGVGPKVVYYFSEEQVMILEYLSAETMSKEALNRPGMPASIAMAIRRLHSSSRFLSDFNMFRLTDYYLKTCLERSIRVPDGYAEGELGNTCQELEYQDDQIEEVCAVYFGQPSANMIARMKLNMIMSDVGWGLWAAIQANISKIEFDFWGWSVERWSRAKMKLDSSNFPAWLRDVQAS